VAVAARRLTRGLIMAAGVMVTIPALIFFIAVQRY
jgi:ABC-type glycerol-3-phosphate transport system permease component